MCTCMYLCAEPSIGTWHRDRNQLTSNGETCHDDAGSDESKTWTHYSPTWKTLWLSSIFFFTRAQYRIAMSSASATIPASDVHFTLKTTVCGS